MSDEVKWLIYSREHNAWWRPDAAGYTNDIKQAGRYSKEHAEGLCKYRDPQRDNSVSEFAYPAADAITRVVKERDAAQAEVARLREALKPFAIDLSEEEFWPAIFDMQVKKADIVAAVIALQETALETNSDA